MTSTITVESVERVPEGVRVRDYDELDEPAKHRFPKLVEDEGTTRVEPDVEQSFEDCVLVKFTDYYLVVCR